MREMAFWPHLCSGTRRIEWHAAGEPCNWCEERERITCDAPDPPESSQSCSEPPDGPHRP